MQGCITNCGFNSTSPLVPGRSIRESATSLLFLEAADVGELLPVLHVILCSSGSLDRSNTVKHFASLDSDSVETPFTAPCTRISIANETVAGSGAAEGCVKDKGMLRQAATLDCFGPNIAMRQ